MSAPAVGGADPPPPDPDYGHLDLSFDDDELWGAGGTAESGGAGGDAGTATAASNGNADATGWDGRADLSTYILGTLIVRVVAARDLQPVVRGGIGHLFWGGGSGSGRSGSGRSLSASASPSLHRHRGGGGSGRRLLDAGAADPYARLRFGDQSQRTTTVAGTTDPVWPREEQSYFDVTVRVGNLAQEGDGGGGGGGGGGAVGRYPDKAAGQGGRRGDGDSGGEGDAGNWDLAPAPPRPVLSAALFHSAREGRKGRGAPKWSHADEDGQFLGHTSVDLTEVLTGKVPCLDEWLPLEGGEDVTGEVRLLCEYEPSDPPPRPGDLCRFTGYCDPLDLYPVPADHAFRVDDAEGDEVILSYTSPEGWNCTFQVHRFMLVCAVRHQAALERYREHLAALAERMAYSPLVGTMRETVDRVPDDGLIFVGVEAAVGGAALMGRWFRGGVQMALGDIVYATNLDGRHLPDRDGNGEDGASCGGGADPDLEGYDNGDQREDLPGMPCCPITRQPMRNPVVAADGHTYERRAISRWLKTSDTSPLTGGVLPHKELVPNYLLLSSCREGGDKNGEATGELTQI